MNIKYYLKGFTFVELAIVLVIVGLLLGGLIVPITAQMDMQAFRKTNASLEEIKDSLIGYAIINGRLPCPATAASNGLESFCPSATGTCVGTETTVVQTHGNCSSQINSVITGFLPASTLGMSPQDAQGFAIDGWGGDAINRIRYAVSPNAGALTFTASNGMKNAGVNSLASPTLLYVCGAKTAGTAPLATCTAAGAVQLANNAVFVIYSVGKNAATGGTGTDEAVNPNPNSPNTNNDDVVFISQDQTSTFDDVLSWVPSSLLISRMVSAGALP
jgi:prepilin-type N-terminal cleavage/methylation domain-containing protein